MLTFNVHTEGMEAIKDKLAEGNENGQKIDVAPNIIEIAKLKTTSELYNTTEPLTQESYNRRLRDNIA